MAERKENIQLVTVTRGPRAGHWHAFVSGGRQYFLRKLGELGQRICP